MSRKDYQLIAAILWHRQPSQIVHPEQFAMWRLLVADFAIALDNDNPRFDTFKFHNACCTGKGLR